MTALFQPNTKVPFTSEEVDYDVDWTNQQEGKSATIPNRCIRRIESSLMKLQWVIHGRCLRTEIV